MFDDNAIGKINRLNFENLLWLLFAVLCFANIYGDYNEKEYLNANLIIFKSNSIKYLSLLI